jgi:hypothetical protein
MKVYNPAGRYVTLFSRPGVHEVADDGSTPAGESGVAANFSPSYLVTMFDATERDGEEMGATLRDDQAIGNFMLQTPALFRPNAGAAGGEVTLSAFNGVSPAGVWTLCVGDAVVGDSGFIDYWQVILRATTSACVPDARTLCLNRPGADTEGRFRVTATWETPNGASGTAQAIRLTNDTGYFWFFSETNVETVVKVLDGCLTNNRFWVFAGGLTDVHVTITVEDTRTGARKTYSNPQGTAFLPIQDTQAFATCL